MKNLPLMYLEANPPKLPTRHGQFPLSTNGGAGGDGNALDLVEHHAGGLVDAVEADNGRDNCHQDGDLVVGDGQQKDVIVVDAVGCVVLFALGGLGLGLRNARRRLRRGRRPPGLRRRLCGKALGHVVEFEGCWPRCRVSLVLSRRGNAGGRFKGWLQPVMDPSGINESREVKGSLQGAWKKGRGIESGEEDGKDTTWSSVQAVGCLVSSLDSWLRRRG